MKLFRWFAVSFSMFSRIPMPHFKWEEDDMSNSLMFFPWVGAAIGVPVLLAGYSYYALKLPFWAIGVLILLIPIVLTGGFHLDGYMDVKDALSSYADRDKKLEILKDPHVGSFAIIGIITRIMLSVVSICLILLWGDMKSLLAMALVFWISRCVTAITSLTFPKARKEGMLYNETKKTNKGILVFLVFQLLTGLGATVWADYRIALFELIAGAGLVFYYRYKMNREFGGVTGDTAGFFLTCFESDMFLIMAVCLCLM